MEDNNQSKINKQLEGTENQTAQNSNNQGIKEKINQNNHTSKMADHMDWLRKTEERQWTMWAGWLKGKLKTQSWLWDMARVAMVGETPLESMLGTSGSATLFPLWLLPRRQCCAAQQKGLPCLGEYLRSRPLTTYQQCQDKEIRPKRKNRAKPQKKN